MSKEPTSNAPVQAKKKKEKTPKWLKNLEAQSWQAELLISGLVIAGLFKLPSLFVQWLEIYLIQSSELEFLFLRIVSFLILAGADSLIAFFGIHFIFRGIWVALLGLSSVYPKGINVNSTNAGGAKYWKKEKEKFPNLSAYNVELDKKCSLIFSIATVIIIMLSSLSILIFITYQLFQFFISIFPVLADYVVPMGIGIYIIFMVLAFGMQFLIKKYPNNKYIEKYSDFFSSIVGSVFSLYIFRKSIGYISSILLSNMKSKYFFVTIILFCGILDLIGVSHISNNSIFSNFRTEKYFTFNNQTYRKLDFNYENLKPKDTRIFTPLIPSDIIDVAFLKLFIPHVGREETQMNLKSLSIMEKLKGKQADREAIYQENLKRYADFNRIFVNEIAYSALEFEYYKHPNANEKGILTYIPTDNFKHGKNILEIRKNYFSKDSVQKIVKIPFFFEKKK